MQEEAENHKEGEPQPAFDLKNFKCPHCGSKGETLLLKEASFLTYLASLVTLFLFGFFSIILLPLIIQSSKTIVRRCGDCYEILEQHDLFSLPSLSDEVLNFRCGNCAVVISRKYLLVVVAILAVYYCYSALTSPPALIKNRLLTDLTWEKYIEDCGRSVFLNNGVRAKKNFEDLYKHNKILWEGAYTNMQKKIDPYTSMIDHYHLYVKMIPTDSAGDYPDITFKFSQHYFKENAQRLQQLKPGDIISFSAEFSHIGDEFSFHFLELLDFNKTEKTVEIDKIPSFELKETRIAGNLRKEAGKT